MFSAPFATVVSVNSGSFQLLMVCAFSQDFTDRVRAVSSGEIFRREGTFDSPLRGRSARKLCWLMGINSWITWAAHLIIRPGREGGFFHSVYRNRLPIWAWLAPCVLIAVLLWAKKQRSTWKADLALLFCCLAPPLLVATDLLLIPKDICGIPGMPFPVCFEFQATFGAYAVMLVLTALQAQHRGSVFQHAAQEPQPDVPEPSRVAVAVVRHAERADDMHVFDDWGCSQDARDFPFDPPITTNGVQPAKELAYDLKKQLLAVDLVISSPYLRCLQTAEILAEAFDAVVLLDSELGEVLGPSVFETRPPSSVRSWQSAKSLCRTQRAKAGRAMDKKPQWPETLKDARVRYAKRFLDYLRRSRRAKKSCILVTHGHMVQVCANILPATQHLKVDSVNYAAALLATCHQGDGSTAISKGVLGASGSADFGPVNFARAASFDKAKEESVETNLEKAEEKLLQGNQLLQDVNMKYWSVWCKGLRSISGHAASMPPILRELQTREEQLGMSWQDLVRLLGMLSVPCEFLDKDRNEEASSFHSNTGTMSSMAHFRHPRGMRGVNVRTLVNMVRNETS
eukprot:s3233_g2.t1